MLHLIPSAPFGVQVIDKLECDVARQPFEVLPLAEGRESLGRITQARHVCILPSLEHSRLRPDWHDYAHRCRIEFSRNARLCRTLGQRARASSLWLTHDQRDFVIQGAWELKRHLEILEAYRRYDRGWMIGGHTRPVRQEILRLGGLWLGKHKTWTMPDRETWLYILSLLPGDF